MQLGKKTFIIYPGRFHPFHKGHKGVYDYLTSKFSGDDVYITSTDKVEIPKSPFSFDEKKKMMVLTGVPSNKILNVKRNYNVQDLSGKIPIDINRDSIAFVVSEKDMAEDPRFSKFTKKDGSPAYLQPMPKSGNMEPAIKHGYIVVAPTTDFNVFGKPARSASELRKRYVSLNDNEKKLFITDLFGSYNEEVKNILDSKLNPIASQLTERQKNLIKRFIRKLMNEDQKDVDAATKRTDIALKNQREVELKNANEKLESAKEKLRNSSDETKDSAEEEVSNAENSVDRAKDNLKAARIKASI